MAEAVKKRVRKSKVTLPDSNDFMGGRIVPVGETSEWLSLVIYGRSGTGKTTFAGTMPKPLLILDINDKGTISVKSQPDTYVMSVETWEDFEEVFWYLNSGQSIFKSVALDTVSQLQELALTKVTGRGNEVASISRRAWGETAALMKTWILNVRDLPLHKGFIAQDRVSTNEDSDEDLEMIIPEVGPALMPSVAKTQGAAADVIGQTFIRERVITTKLKKGGVKERQVVEYCMRIGPHARYLTKLRRDKPGGQLIQVLVDPTFGKIVKLIEGDDLDG